MAVKLTLEQGAGQGRSRKKRQEMAVSKRSKLLAMVADPRDLCLQTRR